MDRSTDDFLAHYGVKGMKWGRRKSEPVKGSVDYQRSRKALKKKPEQLSNKQLKDLNARLQLEKSYSDLTKKKPGKFSAGHNKAKELLGVAGTLSAAYAFTQSPLAKRVKLAYLQNSRVGIGS